MQNFGLLMPDRVGLKRYGRLHSSQAEKLHHVVGNHVTQRAGVVEISATLLDADGLSICNLHMVYVAPVPDWLEDSVVETEDHDILHGLFSQVVVNSVDLVFTQYIFYLAV